MCPQCFGCQGYGHIKFECPTYLKSKSKAMVVTLSDGEVFDDESGCDEDGNFIAFTTTAVVNESISAEENPSNGELSEDVDLQEAYNKLCKVAAKDAMNVELGLKKIASLELDKKILLVKLFDATEILNNVKTENMLLIDKVKNLENELSATEIAYLAKNFRNFLRNNNRRARDKNTAEPRNFRKNYPTKVNNTNKPREKVGQSSNNSMGPQCFGCQGYSHMKSECPTYLKSKG